MTLQPETNELETSSSAVQNVLQIRLHKTIAFVKTAGKKIGIAFVFWLIGYFNFSILWIFIGLLSYMFLSEKAKGRNVHSEKSKKETDDPKELLKNITEIFRLSGSQVPSWMYFPDVEKADWINTVIQQLWPFVGKYVKTIIFDQVQPSIRDSSTLLSNFKFTDVVLGDRAPRVSAVKVYGNDHTRRNEIIIDMQLVLDSECNIGVTVNRLQAGISNFRISGLLRIELQPLLGTMPLVGAISVAFVKDPSIDFDLTHLANLFDFPGFDILLRGAIADSIGAMFVLPEKYVLKLCPELDMGNLRYPLPKGVIRIHVISATNLEEKDRKVLGFGGGSDPYVNVKELQVRVGHKQKFKTKVIHHNVNPEWNESFDAIIDDFQYTKIEFLLYDDDGALNKADYLGYASITAKTVYECGVVDETVTLSEVSHGQLHVRLEWFDLSTDVTHLKEAMSLSSSVASLHSAFLNVYVDGAQRLPSNQQETYNPSPILKITSNKDLLKTKIANNTNNPVWEENFQILLRNPHEDHLLFELKDKSSRVRWTLNRTCAKIKKSAVGKARKAVSGSVTSASLEEGLAEADGLGNFRYSVKHLLQDPDLTVHQPFSLQNSGSNSVLNLRMTLRILKMRSTPSGAENNVAFTVLPSASKVKPSLELKTDTVLPVEETTPTPEPSPLSRSSPESPAKDASVVDNKSLSESVSSLVFVDKTLQTFYEGSPVRSFSQKSYDHSNLSRSVSIASEISHYGEVNDLRKRLNAKRAADTESGGGEGNGLGRVKLSISHRKNTLSVRVICAENLIVCDENHQTSDPYVRVYIIPHKNHRKKTKVIRNNLNPNFDQKLEFSVSPKDVSSKKLNVTVKNQTGFLSSEKVLMGQVIIDLSGMDLSQMITEWYNLELLEKS